MKKAYYLGSCSTCKRILSAIDTTDLAMQDIKQQALTNEQIQEMAKLAGTYEALFSRRAQKYKQMGLKDIKLTEEDYKKLILEHYTFLKRPVFIIDSEIFIGNSPKVIEELKTKF